MKSKLLIFGLSLSISSVVMAQVDCQRTIDSLNTKINNLESNLRNNSSGRLLQAGLTTNMGMNFLVPGKTKLIESGGLGSCFSIGMVINKGFKNAPTIGFSTGLEFDFDRNRYKALPDDTDPTNDVYYDFSDSEILSLKDSSNSIGTFKLQERTQKSIYITIPLMMMFRTEYIGEFRYFGKFGVRNSFLIRNSVNDYGVELPVITAQENNGFTAPTDQFFYKGSVGLSAGAEWKFLSTTSLVAEVGYFYGVTPLHLERKEQNRSLYTVNNGTRTYFSNKANQNQLLFKISILF